MHTSQLWPRPPLLLGVAVFAAVALLLGRGVLPSQEPPALVVAIPGEIRVMLGEGFPSPGVHQYSDGITLKDVINLTDLPGRSGVSPPPVTGDTRLVDGMALTLSANPAGMGEITAGWMAARQRLALGILLHPDRMSLDDWVTLPGIGEKLAKQIELDRQNNGDFGRFEALQRVKGIGPAKLQALQPYFVQVDK